MTKKLKLNIQYFAKKEDDDQDKDLSPEEKLAQALIDLDVEKTARENAIKERDELAKKNENLTGANSRLMKRISEKEEKEDNEDSLKNKNAKITDLFDYKSGKLSLKK